MLHCLPLILLLHRRRNRGGQGGHGPPTHHKGGAKNVYVEYCIHGHKCNINHEFSTKAPPLAKTFLCLCIEVNSLALSVVADDLVLADAT